MNTLREIGAVFDNGSREAVVNPLPCLARYTVKRMPVTHPLKWATLDDIVHLRARHGAIEPLKAFGAVIGKALRPLPSCHDLFPSVALR
jgi:hypothetical protein